MDHLKRATEWIAANTVYADPILLATPEDLAKEFDAVAKAAVAQERREAKKRKT